MALAVAAQSLAATGARAQDLPLPSASAPATSAPAAPASQPAAATGAAAAGAAPGRPRIESSDGVAITFVSEDPAMEIYLAHGDVPARTEPDPFERVGVVPVTVKLAPGQYTIETASAKSSTGHERLVVEANAPVTVEVRAGDAMVKAFGGMFIALGVVAAILGVVAIVSIAPNDSSYNRWGIGLPLVLGGVGGAGLGVGLTAIGSTNVVAPHLPPGGATKGHPMTTWGPSWTMRF